MPGILFRASASANLKGPYSHDDPMNGAHPTPTPPPRHHSVVQDAWPAQDFNVPFLQGDTKTNKKQTWNPRKTQPQISNSPK